MNITEVDRILRSAFPREPEAPLWGEHGNEERASMRRLALRHSALSGENAVRFIFWKSFFSHRLPGILSHGRCVCNR